MAHQSKIIMKKTLVSALMGLLAFQVSAAEGSWTTDFPAAQEKAKKEDRLVLMDFTGSDWCGWCKKLDKDVFSTTDFQDYAKKNLILVEVDFPSKKKQSDDLKKANQALKEKYAVRGFPTIVLLDKEGKEVWKQVGYLAGGPEAFIGKIEEAKKK